MLCVWICGKIEEYKAYKIMQKTIKIDDKKEKELVKELEKRTDIKAERIKRLLKLPDLTKKKNSPVKILADQILKLPRFADFDLLDFPRIVTVEQNFDLLNAPKDHPSRQETDTYYVTEKDILRTQMTVMWSFYLKDKKVLEKLEKEGSIALLAPGIVFRKDEIDRKHFPAFHQIDGLYICKKSEKVIRISILFSAPMLSINYPNWFFAASAVNSGFLICLIPAVVLPKELPLSVTAPLRRGCRLCVAAIISAAIVLCPMSEAESAAASRGKL